VVVASRNDPYDALDAVAALAVDWGADLIDAPNVDRCGSLFTFGVPEEIAVISLNQAFQ